MLYAIVAHDTLDSLAQRRATRPAHLARLTALQDEGRLVLAGPRPRIDAADPGDAGFSGSLVVAEFESLEAATAWAKDDPYVHAGVYASVDVYPFVKTLPK
ncbi:YciI family protein [Solimonas marina]|uniref:YciI family protein n=1 Tax=Solimonas marina TaxID=2714601 RepID=A0A969WAS8_9GAMM|nr:YciI family protein [Solimonas marina]NKF22660.1 YciI family protein [Solimonas marina]